MTEPKSAKIITLQSVLESSPSESEEERRVINSIEQNDPTGRSSKYFDAATCIPSEALDGNRDDSFHSREGVDDELFNFTNSICNIHLEMQANYDDNDTDNTTSVQPETPAKVYRGDKRVPSNSQDSFAANAGNIFHRFATRRRPKIRRGNKKKNASSHHDPGIVGDIESDGGRFAKKMKTQSLESMQEFRNLMKSNKEYTISYVKNALCLIIMPSTILAAM